MRRLASVLLILAGILPGWVYALGLGEINLHSYLNQPLSAEINVHSASDEDLNNLIVSLAPVSEFSKIGIDYMPGLEHLVFSIEKKSDGNAVIKVVTKESFREPFLNFLLEINWPKGRMLREYTLLVDPPVLIESSPAVTQPAVVAVPEAAVAKRMEAAPVKESTPEKVAEIPPPVSTSTKEKEQPKPVKAEQPKDTAETAPAPAMKSVGSMDPGSMSYGRTKRNDTLWTIAKEVRPDEGVSVNQAMLGLLRENPEAFIGNNINRLKAGYVLQVPDRAAMTSLSRAAARNEVSKQYREWKNLGRKTSVGKSADESVETSSRVPAAKQATEGRLELLAPETGDESRSEAGTQLDENASKEEIRKQLAFVRESEEAKSQENAELQMRVSELEAQIENINRLANLKDDQLAALQSKLAELQKEGAKTEAEKKEPVEKAKAEALTPEDKQEQPVKQTAPQPKQEPGLIDQWLDDSVMSGIVGGVILLVLILVAIMVKRRTSTDGFKESILQVRVPAAEPSESPVHINEVLDSSVQEKKESEEKGEETPPPQTSSYLSDFAVSSIGSMHDEAGEADPLTEADVFLAYGRFQPAEAMIKEAIESQPERSDLRFKLLEIYYAARNESSFEQEATAFKEVVADDPIWDKVVEMGQDLCPGSILFGGSGSSTVAEPEAEIQSEVEDAAQEEPVSEQAFEPEEGEAGTGEVSDSEFDTKLNSAIEEQPVNDSPIDFDLGDFEVEGDQGEASKSASTSNDIEEPDFDLGGSESVAESLADELEAMASDLDTSGTDGADDVGVASVMEGVEGEQDLDFDLGDNDQPVEGLADDLEAMASSLTSEDDAGVASIIEVETDNEQNPDFDLEAGESSVADLDNISNQVEEDLAGDLEAMASSLDMEIAEEDSSSSAGVEIPNIDADFEFDTVDSTLADDGGSGDGEDSPLSDEDDEMGTKLDLARAYVDMGDPEGAKSILNEVVEEGDEQQKNEAQELLQKIV